VLAFPLQMRLMADGSFPFPLLGLVHLDNSIVQRRPISASEQLDLSVRAEDLRAHPKGRAFTLVAEARSDGELVWEERGTILRRGKGDPDAPAPPRPPAVAADATAIPEWKLDDGLGRRYGAASGDRNPIHMHALSAKAFGFPRAIAHGMWSKARCLAQLETKLPPALATDVAFGKPLLLPARVRFASEERSGGEVGFAIRSADGSREHLVGLVRPA
jgi:acyl dehydratase